jgi:MtN3 and saliva related transmembrane protein
MCRMKGLMKLNYIEILGVVAGFVSTLAFWPQAVKVYKTKKTRGLSLGMYRLYCLGLVLWSIYAYLIGSFSLLLTEVVTGVMAFYILFMKMRNMARSRALDKPNH